MDTSKGGEGQVSPAEPSPFVDFTAGVIAGGVGLVVGQPIDVVKVRYQTPAYNGKYHSITGALSSIVKHEGVPGLFKGVMSPMTGIAFLNGVIFSSYSFFLRLQHPKESEEPSLRQITLAGVGSGVAASLITTPVELIKIRQQSLPPNQNPSTWKVTTDILRQQGLRGLYRGLGATALRDVAYGPYFLTYEGLCRFMKWRKAPDHVRHPVPHAHATLIDEAEAELHSDLNWGELMFAGGAAGVVAWAVTFPMDVVKTRMQSAADGELIAKGIRPPGIWQTAVTSVRTEGWRVLTAGLWPTIVRAIPTNMVIFLTFEGLMAAMS